MIRPTVRMVFTRDYVLLADNPCPADKHSYGYWAKEANRLLADMNAHCVILVNRGSDPQVRYRPANDEIMLVPSTGGRYGKRRMVRYGEKVCRT